MSVALGCEPCDWGSFRAGYGYGKWILVGSYARVHTTVLQNTITQPLSLRVAPSLLTVALKVRPSRAL